MLDQILIVDDEPLVLCALANLMGFDYEVDTATNGRDAIEMLSRKEYAVLISDMKMPGMSGAALLKYANENYPRTARLLLTAYCDVDEQTMAVGDGRIHGMLYKPCKSVELKIAIFEAIAKVNSSTATLQQCR